MKFQIFKNITKYKIKFLCKYNGMHTLLFATQKKNKIKSCFMILFLLKIAISVFLLRQNAVTKV